MVNDPSNQLDVINVDVKVGLLHTVANAIYASTEGKIREAVSNSKDNEATYVVIYVDKYKNRLFIHDNGKGISRTRFYEIFQSIGYGSLNSENGDKLSYFGLGLMSIFQLGDTVKIYTKSNDNDDHLLLEVKANEIFLPDNKNKSLSFMNDNITLSAVDVDNRNNDSHYVLNEYIKQKFGGVSPSYTEIIIENIDSKDLDNLCDISFIQECSKILPLKLENDESFLNRFIGEKRAEIESILNSDDFCSTIDVYYGYTDNIQSDDVPDEGESEEKEIEQLYKYFPKFQRDLEFPDSNIIVGYSDNRDYAYYIVHTVAKDFYRGKIIERENGFWLRNKNFLVKKADFLEKPGPGRPIITKPLRTWIYGEIFHNNMNPFLLASRTDFRFNDTQFMNFREDIVRLVRPLDKVLRNIWARKKKINDNLIEPFKNIDQPNGIFDRTTLRLYELMSDDTTIEDFKPKVYENLQKCRKKELENENKFIEKILKDNREVIDLGGDEDLCVTIDPNIHDKDAEYDTKWDSERERVVISISPTLFFNRTVKFMGDEFCGYMLL